MEQQKVLEVLDQTAREEASQKHGLLVHEEAIENLDIERREVVQAQVAAEEQDVPHPSPAVANYDDMNAPLIGVIGVVSVVLVFAFIVGVQALYYTFDQAETERKVVSIPNVEADNLIAEQEAQLQRYGWIDRSQGVVTIPIEESDGPGCGRVGDRAAGSGRCVASGDGSFRRWDSG